MKILVPDSWPSWNDPRQGTWHTRFRKLLEGTLAETWRSASNTLAVRTEAPSAEDIWSAAVLKSQFPISYADAFAAALAQKHRCAVVTGDPEFRSVDQLAIEWLA